MSRSRDRFMLAAASVAGAASNGPAAALLATSLMDDLSIPPQRDDLVGDRLLPTLGQPPKRPLRRSFRAAFSHIRKLAACFSL